MVPSGYVLRAELGPDGYLRLLAGDFAEACTLDPNDVRAAYMRLAAHCHRDALLQRAERGQSPEAR
jgi:hypothetical protein